MTTQRNGVSSAERTTRSSFAFRIKPQNIATVDFGTTHCSVTYQLNAHIASEEDKPQILTLDELIEKDNRVPSCILFDKQGKRRFFGYQARNHYYKMEHASRPDWIYFEQIKMKLQHDKNVDRNMKVDAMNGRKYFLIDVIAHILCHLKEQLLGVVNDFGLDFDATDFDWVITVPAIWKAKGKRMMREAGYKAGLCSSRKTLPYLREALGFSPRLEDETSPEKLSLALEPESAAVYCQHEAKTAKQGADKKFLPKSDHYLVLDIGGGTVDIATHSMAGGGIVELAPSAGNDWGGTRVNQEFEKFLEKFLGDHGFSRYLNQSDNVKYARHKADLTNLVYTKFEAQKKDFGSEAKAEESFAIEFPRTFWKIYEGNLVRAKSCPGIKIEDDGSVIRIMPEKMAEFFKPVVDGINDLVESHIRSYNLSSIIDTVYLVGGFGGCTYLHKQIEAKLYSIARGMKTCVPCQPNLAVIYGATAFRCNPGFVTKRKADASYGLGCAIRFDESLHRRDYKFWNGEKNAYFCNNLFMAFVERGDPIATDDVYVKSYVPRSSDQQSMTFTMYSAPRRDVWYITEDEVYKLGLLTINMGGFGLDREVELVLDITHSELQLLARDKTSGNEVKLIADFLSSERD